MQSAGIKPVVVAVKPLKARQRKAGADLRLTRAETTVLQAIANCGTVAATAEKLGMKRRTVESHLAHIRLKLNMATTVEALVWAWRRGLVE